MRNRALGVLAVVLAAATALAADDKGRVNTIKKVSVKGQTVEIVGTQKPSFTTFPMSDPPRFVIDISEAVFSGVPEDVPVSGSGRITAIKTASYGDDASAIARVVIGFDRDVEPDVVASGNTLVVKVGAGAPPAVASRAAPPAAASSVSAQDRAALDQGRALATAATASQAKPDQQATREALDRANAAKQESDRKAAEAAAAEQARQAEVARQRQAIADAEAQRKAKEQADREARARAEQERVAQDKARAEAIARAEAEKKAQQDAARAAAARAEADRKAQEEAARAAAARAEADRKAQEEAARTAAARAEAQRNSQEQAALAAAASAAAEKKAQQDAAARAESQRRAQEDAARAEAQRKAQEEAARAESQRRAQEDAARAEAQRKAQEEAARAEAQRRAQEDAARTAAATAAAERKAQEDAARAASARAQPAPASQATMVAQAETRAPASRQASDAPASAPSAGGVEVSSRRKTVTLVGFSPDKSRVFVRTSEPVRYTVSQADARTVVLELENTTFQRSNDRRPLDTHFFGGPVVQISPSPAGGKTVRVAVTLRDKVEYQARQDGNEVSLQFAP